MSPKSKRPSFDDNKGIVYMRKTIQPPTEMSSSCHATPPALTTHVAVTVPFTHRLDPALLSRPFQPASHHPPPLQLLHFATASTSSTYKEAQRARSQSHRALSCCSSPSAAAMAMASSRHGLPLVLSALLLAVLTLSAQADVKRYQFDVSIYIHICYR